MQKKIISLLAVAAVLISAVSLVSCRKSLKKAPESFTEPFNYDLSEYVKLGEYKGIKYTPFDTSATDDQIQAKLASELKEHTTAEIVTDRGAKMGDVLTINYSGTVDGEQFEGGTATEQTITLGESGYISGFDEGLVGVKAGESVTLHLKFPNPYNPKPEFSGKDVDFLVLVRFVRSVVVPELTDGFVASVGEYESVADYMAYITSLVEADNKSKAELQKISDVWGAIIENTEVISVPQEEIDASTQKMIETYTGYAKYYNKTLDEFLSEALGMDYDTFYAQAKEYSEKSVEQELILYSIVHAENIKLTDKDYDEGLKRLAEENNTTVEELESQNDFELLWENVMWDKVMTFLTDNAVAVEADTAAADTLAES